MDEKENNVMEKNDNMIFCSKCGQQYNKTLEMCPFCGEKNVYHKKTVIRTDKKRNGFSTVKLVIGIMTLCFFILFFFQSCTAFTLGGFVSSNTSASGLLGLLGALCFMIAGILVIVAKDKQDKAINYVTAGFYWAVFFFGCMARSGYPDALVWGVLSYIFGTVILFSLADTKKSKIITAVAAIIYFVLGII